MATCPFCKPLEGVIAENGSAIAIGDKFPISLGHTLIIPRRHVPSIFNLSQPEYSDCFALVRAVREEIELRHSPAGFNLAVNDGSAAGQTVDHAHIHIVPRYPGDALNPKGLLHEYLPGPGKS